MTIHNDIAEFEKIATDTLSKLSSYLHEANQAGSHASGYAPMREVLQRLDIENYMHNGGMTRESFEDFLDGYLKNSVQLHSPSYIAHQVSVPDHPGLLSGMINAVMNNPMAIYEMGPAAATLEFVVVNWMLQKIGWVQEPMPDRVDENTHRSSHAAGVLVHGGSLANLTCMLAARAKVAPNAWTDGVPNDLAIMVPRVSHYSNARAIGIIGLGSKAIYPIDVNEWGVVLVESLEATYANIKADGKRCMAVIANASSTATGLHDPLVAMGEFCQKHSLWFHVDACHGATALLSKASKHYFEGVELADSFVWDAHKMMQVPVVCAAALFKSAKDLDAAFHQEASYLAYGENREGFDAIQRAVECTKSSLSLKIFLNIAFRGEQALGEYVDNRYAMAKVFHGVLSQRENFYVPYEPETNILCFRYQGLDGKASDSLQQKIRFEMMKRKEFHITSVLINDVRYLRVTIMNKLTDEQVLMSLLDKIEELATEFS
jgi:L-2,4-diaminobutyrate decarboxylase